MADVPGSTALLLPKELMELQLGQMDLLMAMYPSEDDVLLEESCRGLLDTLRGWCDGTNEDPPSDIPPDLSLVLNLDVAEDSSSPTPKCLQLDVAWPLRYEGPEIPTEPPGPRVRIRQPGWLSRAETSRLMAEIPPDVNGGGAGDILGVIEQVKEATGRHIADAAAAAPLQDDDATVGETTAEPLVRAWFYFPSISTRSKRDDLVRHAPGYGLTGFLLAGKPGVLCLEGGARGIDVYMRFVRTESWGDIPAHHKKVSERYRELGLAGRAFAGMREITETLGAARRGERANRSDMKALEAWLGERGLGDAFSKVLI